MRGASRGDPREAVFVGVAAEAAPEAANFPENGGPLPSATLQAGETASLVAGDPKADGLGVLDDRGRDFVLDLRVQVLQFVGDMSTAKVSSITSSGK